MRHRGFVLIETLVSGLVLVLFLLFLLQAYGSTMAGMNHANIVHQGLNLGERVAAGKTENLASYTVKQEAGDYRVIKVKYHEEDLLNLYQAP